MFMFGFLKFFEPFHGWFEIQIRQSHLPRESILVGKLAEMVVGCLFVLPWLRRSLAIKRREQLLLIACTTLVIQMCVAIYVHLQPEVPASVLPLGIELPVIPGVVLLLALWVRGTLAPSTGPDEGIRVANQARIVLCSFPEVREQSPRCAHQRWLSARHLGFGPLSLASIG